MYAHLQHSFLKQNDYQQMLQLKVDEWHKKLVDDLIIHNQEVKGIVLDNNKKIYCNSLVITTGTFLGGKIFVGDNAFEAGRIGDQSSSKLS